jgi:hypothetical protein
LQILRALDPKPLRDSTVGSAYYSALHAEPWAPPPVTAPRCAQYRNRDAGNTLYHNTTHCRRRDHASLQAAYPQQIVTSEPRRPPRGRILLISSSFRHVDRFLNSRPPALNRVEGHGDAVHAIP